MSYPYDSRTSLVEGACLSVSFLSSLGDGGVEADDEGEIGRAHV
jgi:hypothetical protein